MLIRNLFNADDFFDRDRVEEISLQLKAFMDEVYPDEIPMRMSIERSAPIRPPFPSSQKFKRPMSQMRVGKLEASDEAVAPEVVVDDVDYGWCLIVRSRLSGSERRTMIDHYAHERQWTNRATFEQLAMLLVVLIRLPWGRSLRLLARRRSGKGFAASRKGIDFQRWRVSEMNPISFGKRQWIQRTDIAPSSSR